MTQAHTEESTRAFEALLSPILRDAFGLAYHLSRNDADAADLVQEAALSAFRHFATFQRGTNFKAWFYRILTNAFFGKRRKEKRRPAAVDLDDVNELYLYERTAEIGLHRRTEDPAGELMRRMTGEQIAEALRALPEHYSVVATLYFQEDMAYQEIAEILDCPVGTVRSRLHRARAMLQKSLWTVAVDAGIPTVLSQEQAAS